MDRQIKFRALTTGNNSPQIWVYGYFVKDYSGRSFITSLDGADTYTVNFKTVGQFTGLKDKNGVEIYEGDIIESGNGRKWQVYFGNYQYYKDTPSVGFYLWSKLSVFPLYGNLTIIGNIHQNPELLNQ